MKTATLVRRLTGFTGDARLYRLSEPHEGHSLVIVSATYVLGEPETYIFAADERGEVTGWAELDGSAHGALDHSAALRRAGYEDAESAEATP